MPRPKTPTELLRISGGLQRAAKNRSISEPIPVASIGSAPKEKPTSFDLVWDELVAMVPPRVLGCSDRVWLEMTCNLLIEYRTNPQEMVAAKMRLLQNCLVKLGLNPSDRANLATIPSEEKVDVTDQYFD